MKKSITEKTIITKKCMYCLSEIDEQAKICHYCKKYQYKPLNFIPNLAIIVSFGLLVVSIGQLNLASKKVKAAANSMINANFAMNKADSALLISKALEKNTKYLAIGLSNAIRTSSELLIEVDKSTYIWNDTGNKKIASKIDSLQNEMDKIVNTFKLYTP
jgi:hypothetical protein